MPHLRQRYALEKLRKKLSFSRVVAIQGPRQCGKTVLATRLLEGELPRSQVVRFDDSRIRQFAKANPELFLLEYRNAMPLVIDEAQKVPEIFDAVKLRVDQDSQPGQYLLLGSTEFSHLFKIRESLTGRLSRLRLHPLCAAEAHQLKQTKGDLGGGFFYSHPRLSLGDVLSSMERGGMPGIFAVRDEEERESLYEDWVQLTCTRDLYQVPGLKLDSDIARILLDQVAQTEEPELASLAKNVGVTPKVLSKYLRVFEELFVLNRLRPRIEGTGKDRYYLCDSGIAGFLGANQERVLETWLLQEFLVKRDLSLTPSQILIQYYRNPKGSRIPLVIEHTKKKECFAIRAIYSSKADLRDVKLLESFCEKNKAKAFLLLADPAIKKLGSVQVLSWSSVV